MNTNRDKIKATTPQPPEQILNAQQQTLDDVLEDTGNLLDYILNEVIPLITDENQNDNIVAGGYHVGFSSPIPYTSHEIEVSLNLLHTDGYIRKRVNDIRERTDKATAKMDELSHKLNREVFEFWGHPKPERVNEYSYVNALLNYLVYKKFPTKAKPKNTRGFDWYDPDGCDEDADTDADKYDGYTLVN